MNTVQRSANTEHCRSGFLLSRSWHDRADGLELEFWLAAEEQPIRLRFTAQKAIAFVDHDRVFDLPDGVERKPLTLKRLHGPQVDGLYCHHQRILHELRDHHPYLSEADIRPTERYLMERFVTAGVNVYGEFIDRDAYQEVLNPRIEASTCVPDLLAASIDIETEVPGQSLYSIAADCRLFLHGSEAADDHRLLRRLGQSAPRIVFMRRDAPADSLPPMQRQSDYQLHWCSGEREVLRQFLAWLQAADPDLLFGWNVVGFDLRVLELRAKALKLPFTAGRAREVASVRISQRNGVPNVALIPGRAVLDGVDLLRAGFWPLERFSLEHVSQQLLGEGKLIDSDENKVSEINRLFRQDPVGLAEYNFRDTELVNRIFIHAALLPFAIERARLTGLAIDRTGGSVAAFDNLYLPRLHRAGYVAPVHDSHQAGLGSPGGHVLDSQPGLYRNVLLLDFKSLYPSIIRTFLIDPLGLAVPGENPVPGFLGAEFSRQQHILPGLIESLWAARDQAREQNNAALSQAIKIIMNSFYGVLGSSGCRFHRQQLASSITLRGHEIINRSREWIEQQNMTVIYGDTDSVFVWLDESLSRQQAHEAGKRLVTELNSRWRQYISERFNLESALEIEFETLFSRFLMPTVRGASTGSKKRYAGWVINDAGQGRMVIKGLEAVRTDWTPLARRFQRELLQLLFEDRDLEPLVIETARALEAGELDAELVYSKRLRRPLSDYQRNVPPHVQAARKLERPGRTVSYLITANGAEPLGHTTAAPDHAHYRERQLAPVADTILQFLDLSFAALTDAQQSLF